MPAIIHVMPRTTQEALVILPISESLVCLIELEKKQALLKIRFLDLVSVLPFKLLPQKLNSK